MLTRLKSLYLSVVAFLLALFTPMAFAEEGPTGIDTSGIVSAIQGNTAALAAIGIAILVLIYALRVFSWGRKI